MISLAWQVLPKGFIKGQRSRIFRIKSADPINRNPTNGGLSLRAEAAFSSAATSAETNAASLKLRDFLSHIVHSTYSWFMRFCPPPLFGSADSKCEVANRSLSRCMKLRDFTSSSSHIVCKQKNEALFGQDFIDLNFGLKRGGVVRIIALFKNFDEDDEI